MSIYIFSGIFLYLFIGLFLFIIQRTITFNKSGKPKRREGGNQKKERRERQETRT